MSDIIDITDFSVVEEQVEQKPSDEYSAPGQVFEEKLV